MTIWIAWLVLPLVVGALSLGCGLLVERAAGIESPSPLLLPLGFAVVIVGAQFAIIGWGTAPLATPLVVALAVVGFGLSASLESPPRWAAACGGSGCLRRLPRGAVRSLW